MGPSKYDKYFVSGHKQNETKWSYRQEFDSAVAKIDADVIPGAFHFYAHWIKPQHGFHFVHNAHTHPYTEVLGCIGTNPDDPMDFGNQFEIHFGHGFERHVNDKPGLVYIPAGFVHGPILWRIKKPMLGLGCLFGPLDVCEDDDGLIDFSEVFETNKYGKYIISTPKTEETQKRFKNVVAYLDDDVLRGSSVFLITFVNSKSELESLISVPHSSPYDQVLLFVGINPEDKDNLEAEIQLGMGEEYETYTVNKSMAVFIPKGVVYGLIDCKINKSFIFVLAAKNAPKLIQNT